MLKRNALAIFIAGILLVVLAAFVKTEKVSLNATGYDWLGYTKEYKDAFVGLLDAVYGIDKNKNKPVDVIKTLDDFYYGAIQKAKADPIHVDEDTFLKIRCADVIIKLKEKTYVPSRN